MSIDYDGLIEKCNEKINYNDGFGFPPQDVEDFFKETIEALKQAKADSEKPDFRVVSDELKYALIKYEMDAGLKSKIHWCIEQLRTSPTKADSEKFDVLEHLRNGGIAVNEYGVKIDYNTDAKRYGILHAADTDEWIYIYPLERSTYNTAVLMWLLEGRLKPYTPPIEDLLQDGKWYWCECVCTGKRVPLQWHEPTDHTSGGWNNEYDYCGQTGGAYEPKLDDNGEPVMCVEKGSE